MPAYGGITISQIVCKTFAMACALTATTLCGCVGAPRKAAATAHAVTIAPNGVRCTNFAGDATFRSCEERIPGLPGVRCSGAFGPGVPNPPAGLPPVSYAFSELGKRGVPAFDASTTSMLHRIARYIGSKTLRFAYPLDGMQRLVVYDATRGPCDEQPYQVLNLGGVHNAMYKPGEDPNHVMAYPVDVDPTPFPWMRSHDQ